MSTWIRYLLDTNILVRLANAQDIQYGIARSAIQLLRSRGAELRTTPQVLIEFRNVATRPVGLNGLGLPLATVEQLTTGYETDFPILEDTPAVYPAWKALVQSAGVIGKQVHDARLVAVCHAHGVGHLLTFNAAHFARYASLGPGLTAVHPSQV